MTDRNTRALARQAHADPAAEVRAALTRWRGEGAGEGPRVGQGTERRKLTRTERLGLLAYCGQAGAQEVLGGPIDPDWSSDQMGGLPPWVEGFWRWPREVLTRAALAAAELAARHWCRDENCGKVIRCAHCIRHQKALDAARAWLEDPTEERRSAWREPWICWRHDTSVRPLWIPSPPSWPVDWEPGIHAAARATSPETTRAAICAALIAWVLA